MVTATPLAIPEVLLIEPRVFRDDRGFFFESYSRKDFEPLGIWGEFVQDNHSRSAKNVVRGLHYQIREPQGKLVRAVIGEIFDVAVDLRRSSPTFGRWVGQRLSSRDHAMLWIPQGFAHGFVALTEDAEILYKATAYYAPEHERTLLWDDRDLAIDWPLDGEPRLSEKDKRGSAMVDAEVYP